MKDDECGMWLGEIKLRATNVWMEIKCAYQNVGSNSEKKLPRKGKIAWCGEIDLLKLIIASGKIEKMSIVECDAYLSFRF